MKNDKDTYCSERDIYLIAGVGSSLSIFNDCRHELQKRFREAGRDPIIRELFPYGDRTHNLIYQILEVRGDLSRLRGTGRYGGRAVAELVSQLSPRRPVLFIGHSGGGVAAYQAAVMLNKDNIIPDCRIIQVGSPKLPIHTELCNRVSYFLAVDEEGKRNDPITRIGSWGGWSRNRLGLWFWDKLKYAPGHIGTIQVLGGHPHYFRHKAPYVHPDLGSNLSLTLDTIWIHSI